MPYHGPEYTQPGAVMARKPHSKKGPTRKGPPKKGPGKKGAKGHNPHRGKPDMPGRNRDAHHRGPRAGEGGNPHLLFGLHAVAEAWVNPERRIRRLVVSDSGLKSMEKAISKARALGLNRPEPEMRDKAEIDKMLPGQVHQGIVLDAAPLDAPDLVEALADEAGDENSIFVLLDQVSDPHNLGAILRSCAAFGAAGLIVQDRVTPEITGTMAKSACGAAEHVPIIRETNLARAMEQAKEAGYWCVGLDERGESTLADALANGRIVLVLGAEGPGLRRLTAEKCDMLVRLPTAGPIGSLNVSNAAAVSLYELIRAR